MGLGYPYSYGDELSPEMAKRNLVLVCLYWCLLISNSAQGAPLPGADALLCPYSTQHISRASTALSASVQGNQGNGSKKGDVSYFHSELDCIFEYTQLQAKYKHAHQFGVDGNYNIVNRKLFKEALIDHMMEIKPIKGTFHKKPVLHYLDEVTGLNVIVDRNTKKFISGWELTPQQMEHVIEDGNLGGGK